MIRSVNPFGFMTETIDAECGKVITGFGLDKHSLILILFFLTNKNKIYYYKGRALIYSLAQDLQRRAKQNTTSILNIYLKKVNQCLNRQ